MNDSYAGPWVLPVGRKANIYSGLATTLAPTAAVTSAPKGLYRVTLCLAIVSAGTAGNLTLSVPVTQSLANVPVTTIGNIAQDSFICEVGPASNITYQVTALGLTAGSLSYTVRVVVEQLSALT